MKYEIVQLNEHKYAVRRKSKFLWYTYYEYLGRVYWHTDSNSKIFIENFCGFSLGEANQKYEDLLRELIPSERIDSKVLKVIKND